MKKFKKTMREINKSPVQWLEEAIEETIDNLRYLVEAVNRLKKNKSKK
jgi:predicted transcriptional regulator